MKLVGPEPQKLRTWNPQNLQLTQRSKHGCSVYCAEMLKRPLRLLHTNTRVRSVSHDVNTSGRLNPACTGFPPTWQLITQTPKGFIGVVGAKGRGSINTYKHTEGRESVSIKHSGSHHHLYDFTKGLTANCWARSVATPASLLWLRPCLWLL